VGLPLDLGAADAKLTLANLGRLHPTGFAVDVKASSRLLLSKPRDARTPRERGGQATMSRARNTMSETTIAMSP
jgi:hypothetical protein